LPMIVLTLANMFLLLTVPVLHSRECGRPPGSCIDYADAGGV
jgi:hypothetical protein